MASSFGRYTGGIEASTGNLVPAFGQMAAQTVATGVNFGQNIAQGLQAYNDNSAKNDILTAEAEALGGQIQQYAQMFGDSPEHAEFAKSLQPYIEKLSKVPSMSLTQKMGTVTSVKAGFANIGQNLQAFEMMRKEKLNRDFWDAKNTTPLSDIVTDPVMIAKGQAPWSDRKTFDQNVADFRALAQSAVDSTGAAIDINKATDLYKESIKRTIKTGRDIKGRPIAPETLSALQDQIAKAEGYQENEMTTDGVTDYSKEADLYESLSKSASDVVKEKAATEAKANAPEADTIERWNKQKATAQASIDALTGKTATDKAFATANANYQGLVKQDATLYAERKAGWQRDQNSLKKELNEIPNKITALQDFQDSLPTKSKDKNGNEVVNPEWMKVEKQMLALRKRREEITEKGLLDVPEPNNPFNADGTPRRPAPTREEYQQAGDTTENAPDNLAAYSKMAKEADKNISRLNRAETDKAELLDIDKILKRTQATIDSDEAMSLSQKQKFAEGALKYTRQFGGFLGKQSAMDSARTISGEITDEIADRHMESVIYGKGGDTSIANNVAGMITDTLIGTPAGTVVGAKNGFQRNLKVIEVKRLEAAYERLQTKKAIDYAKQGSDPEELISALKVRKTQLQDSLATGVKAPTPAEISKTKAAEAKAKVVDQETLLGVDRTMTVGTKQREVAMSVDRQEKAMAGFFQKKYGYVPAGFSETFKANTPEANFKTMETPYGAFMYDGKTWTQIKTGTPMNAKEAGELAAYKFSNPDGSPKQFANSGVYLSGNFEGTSTELARFRVEYRSLAHAERSIERLIEINEMTGESLSPTLRGEATALLPAIKAALRTEIIGVGTVSNYEQELINDVVAGAANFWSLEASDRAKLSVILARVQDSIADVPAIYGLTVHRQGNSRNVEGALRERLQSSGGMSKREQEWRAKNPDKTDASGTYQPR